MGTKLGKSKRTASKQTVQLNAKEHALIRTLWTRIEFEPKVHGTGFYLRFFAKYPQYIKYFITDPIGDNVNPDALMLVKFTVVMEMLGYLILDFYDKPKEFAKLIGYIGMIHKDMDIGREDLNNFFATLIDYLKDAMSDLMTQSCEAAFVSFFGSFKELMIESIEEENRRFEKENEDSIVARSRFNTILPCGRFGPSSKLIYGQPREYWVLRQQTWKSKMKFWEQDIQPAPGAINLQNTLESTSSEDEVLEGVEGQEQSNPELGSSYSHEDNRVDPFFMQRAKYMNTGRLVSVPHFDQLVVPDSVEIAAVNEIAETSLTRDRYSSNIRHQTPRERHRAKVAAIESLNQGPSRRMISSTDTGTPRDSDEFSNRERRRSTWH